MWTFAQQVRTVGPFRLFAVAEAPDPFGQQLVSILRPVVVGRQRSVRLAVRLIREEVLTGFTLAHNQE